MRPQFVDFICEWAGCRAELHNLDTLRRHVYVVHGRHALRCRWGRCGAAAEVEDGKEEPVAAAAADPDEFRRHVEERHLVPLAWHVGEGPQNSIAGKGSGGGGECCLNNDSVPDFLKDAHGNQVTPSIRDQQVEDRVTWRMNRRRLKELLLRRDENLPSEELDSLVNDEA
ncbi:hypothetical protein CDD83_5111 [Cordyceps sp. RAO-2017]|nr:hypothetical protein CDD83_5111 [Cordyceps sp. RAO-2017]